MFKNMLKRSWLSIKRKIVIIVTHSRQVAKRADKVLTLRRGHLN